MAVVAAGAANAQRADVRARSGRARAVVEHLVRVAAGGTHVAHQAQRQAAARPAGGRRRRADRPAGGNVRQVKPAAHARSSRRTRGTAARGRRRPPPAARVIAAQTAPGLAAGRLARRRAQAVRERRRAAASARAGAGQAAAALFVDVARRSRGERLDLDRQRVTAASMLPLSAVPPLTVTSYSPRWAYECDGRALGRRRRPVAERPRELGQLRRADRRESERERRRSRAERHRRVVRRAAGDGDGRATAGWTRPA